MCSINTKQQIYIQIFKPTQIYHKKSLEYFIPALKKKTNKEKCKTSKKSV